MRKREKMAQEEIEQDKETDVAKPQSIHNDFNLLYKM